MGISGRTLGDFRRDFRGISGRLFRGHSRGGGPEARYKNHVPGGARRISRYKNHVPAGGRRISRYKFSRAGRPPPYLEIQNGPSEAFPYQEIRFGYVLDTLRIPGVSEIGFR